MPAARDIIIDILFLIVCFLAQYPGLTGLLIHEWSNLGLIIVALVHTVLHWDWIKDALRRFSGDISPILLGNLAIDIALYVVFFTVAVSGLMVSRHVLFAFGYYAPGYFVWKPIHAIFAKLFFALVLAHLALHWRWIFFVLKNKTSAD